MEKQTKFRDFLEKKKIVLLDGAMGTELQRRGYPTKLPLWSSAASLEVPKLVEAIHRDYVTAGADIITTNTFRTNIRAFHKAGCPERSEKATSAAVEIAKKVKEETKRSIFVAGSITSVEDCYLPDLAPSNEELRVEHRDQVKIIASLDIDLILIQTMAGLREAEISLDISKKTGFPIAISFVIDSSLNLLSGESLKQVTEMLTPYEPEAVLLNCAAPDIIGQGLRKLREIYKGNIGGYANGIGEPANDLGWNFSKNRDRTAFLYLEHVKEWLKCSPKIVGGCCGTTPEYIKLIREYLDEIILDPLRSKSRLQADNFGSF